MNIDVARRIIKLLGKSRDLIKFVPDRLGHDRGYALTCRKIRALGCKPEVGFEEGLERAVRWCVDDEAWWRTIKEKSADFRAFYSSYYKDRLSRQRH